jgi:hypothetical protein
VAESSQEASLAVRGLRGTLVSFPRRLRYCQLTHRVRCFSSFGIESKSMSRIGGVVLGDLVWYDLSTSSFHVIFSEAAFAARPLYLSCPFQSTTSCAFATTFPPLAIR